MSRIADLLSHGLRSVLSTAVSAYGREAPSATDGEDACSGPPACCYRLSNLTGYWGGRGLGD